MVGSIGQPAVDLHATCMRLKDGLLFVPIEHRTKTVYRLQAGASFYRIGLAEYTFISLLDGHTRFSEAVALSAQALGANALTSAQAMRTYLWLLEHDLAELADCPKAVAERKLPTFNPFWLKCKLGNPSRVFHGWLPWFGWLFSPIAMTFGACLIAVALAVVVFHGERLLHDLQRVVVPSNWLWLLITWAGLKLVHELGHAIACIRHDCDVPEVGIGLLFFAPMAYVDVTASWRLTSKWSRMQVAAAGIYVELLVASLASLAWTTVDSPTISHLLINVMLTASVATLVFNANPLMRFDGYFVLSDLLGYPNLYRDAIVRVQRQLRTLFFGGDERRGMLEASGAWIGVYGWLVFAWRVLVFLSLGVMAWELGQMLGLCLALLCFALWALRPFVDLVQTCHARFQSQPLVCVRACLVASCIAGGVAMLCSLAPFPLGTSAPGVIEYRDAARLRSSTSGFVESVHFVDGQWVQPGDLLVTISNPDLELEHDDVALEVELVERRIRIAIDEQRTVDAQVEQRQLKVLQERLAELRHRVDGLRVVAPQAGCALCRSVEDLPGQFVQEGDLLVTIAREHAKELIVSVSESELPSVIPHLGQPVRVRDDSFGFTVGYLRRIEPRATTDLPYPQLSALSGGSLAVTRDSNLEGEDESICLVEPRFKATVEIDPVEAKRLFSGQRARVSVGWSQYSLGAGVWRLIDW